jgi:cell division protein FtsW
MANPPRTATRPPAVQPTPVRKGLLATRFNLGKAFTAPSPNFGLLLGVTLFLVVFGLVMVLSASTVDSFLSTGQFFGAFGRQLVTAIVGIPLMFMVSRLPLGFYYKWVWVIFVGSAVFQLLVFSPLGVSAGGNTNWVSLGATSVQPSEFMKLSMAIWMGVFFPPAVSRLGPGSPRLLFLLLPPFALIGLVLLGEDMGTAIILFLVMLGCLIFAEVKWHIVAVPLLVGAFGTMVLAITSPNRVARIMTFLNENCTDYSNACWQPLHGKWALANGGIFGVGLGQSKAKWSWLPAADNDYIFAIIGEELGLIGALVVIALFLLMLVAFTRIIRAANDPLVRVATGGIMMWLVLQAFINIGVVLGVLPVLGVPLPFLSSGGSALVSSLLAIGVVLSFARAETGSRVRR